MRIVSGEREIRGTRTGPGILSDHGLGGSGSTSASHQPTEDNVDPRMAALDHLNDALDNLEQVVHQLTDTPLDDTLDVLDTLQRAKLQSLIPYILYDLVFSAFASPTSRSSLADLA